MWFKVDDKLHSHKKTVRAGVPAMGLWVLAGSWCGDQLTDGFIPDYMALRLDPEAYEHAQKLIAAGLWVEAERDGEAGWQFHDWDVQQPTREEVEGRREREREKKRRQRRDNQGKFESSHSSPGVSPGDSVGTVQGTPSVVPEVVPPSRPDPTRPNKRMRIARDAGFEEWWSHYPLKKDKGKAERAYKTAIKLVDQETLIAAADAYAKLVADKPREYIAHGSSWLNGKRWEDEDIAPTTQDSVTKWLRGCWKRYDVRAVEDRSGLTYRAPNPPEDCDDLRTFNLEAIQRWIEENHDQILNRILTKESHAA